MNGVSPNIPPEYAGLGTASSLRVLARPGVAWVVLALCLLVTLIARQVSLQQVKLRGLERFNLQIQQVTNAILNRMQGCVHVLNGAESLFAAIDFVTRREWQRYVTSLDISNRSGIRELGFIAQVPSGQLKSFTASNRLDGVPDFAVHSANSETSGPPYYVIKYVAPLPTNSPYLGLNIATDLSQRGPAELARDTGRSVLTPRIKWQQSVA